MTRALAAVVILLVGVSSVAGAAGRSDSDIEREIRDALMQLHPKDDLAWWRALGPSAPRVVLHMLETTSHIHHRLRLTQALGAYDDPAVVEYLKAQATSTQDNVIRDGAIKAVAASQGVREIEFLASFLKHPDAQTRWVAAERLREVRALPGGQTAEGHLQAFIRDEKVAWVRDRYAGKWPQPGRAPASAPADPVVDSWVGTWNGFLLTPNPKKGRGMKSEAVVLSLIGQASGLRCEWNQKTSAGVLTLPCEFKNDSASRAHGQMTKKKEKVEFDAAISGSATDPVLEVRLPAWGGLAALRRVR